jgi:uncharacterized membrane protein
MADLIIIAYDTEATAEAARKKLFELWNFNAPYVPHRTQT